MDLEKAKKLRNEAIFIVAKGCAGDFDAFAFTKNAADKAIMFDGMLDEVERLTKENERLKSAYIECEKARICWNAPYSSKYRDDKALDVKAKEALAMLLKEQP